MSDMFNGYEKNGSGYNDSTAYHAIVRATLDESRRDKKVEDFTKEIYELCKKNNITILGDIRVKVGRKNGITKVHLDNRTNKK